MGTTSEKLTYLNTTKTLIKEELNLGGANITNEPFRAYKGKLEGIYKDFLANGTDTLWNNWLPKVNGTGETITLNNTIEAKMDFVYKGNTSQKTTTGKNLINDYDLINRYNIASISDNILTTNAINSDYSVLQPRTKTQKIDLVENTKYYVSFDCRLKSGTYSSKLGVSIINGIDATSYSTGNTAISNPNMSSLYQRYSFECISNITTNSFLGIRIQVRTGLSNAVFEIKNIMISTSSDTTYEPYTNGASPNPDYPQDIQVVSGDNTIKVEGKNLFDTTKYTSTSNISVIDNTNGVLDLQGISGYYSGVSQKFNVIPNQTYMLSYNASIIDTSVDSKTIVIVRKSDNSTKIAQDDNTGNQTITFVPEENEVYIHFRVNGETNRGHVKYSNIQLELGNQLSQYTPYQGQTYPINIGNIELCKIGDYQDKIAKSTGKNLFDVSTITENTYIDENGNTGSSQVSNISDYIEVKPNTSYTLSFDYLTLLNSTKRNVVYYNESKTYILGGEYFPTNKTNTITTPNNAKYLRFSYDKNCYSIMLNEGTTALPYEPYGKVWYLNKQIGKVVLDGSESLSGGTQQTEGTYIYNLNNPIPISNSSNWADGYSNYFGDLKNKHSNSFRLGANNNILYFYTFFNKLSDFKTWLSTHNTTVYYVLATPTYEEITDTTLISQSEAIKKSYNNQTNISQTNADKPFILDVVALGELRGCLNE